MSECQRLLLMDNRNREGRPRCMSPPPAYDALPLEIHYTARADTPTEELVAANAVVSYWSAPDQEREEPVV